MTMVEEEEEEEGEDEEVELKGEMVHDRASKQGSLNSYRHCGGNQKVVWLPSPHAALPMRTDSGRGHSIVCSCTASM
jgi:hypothetical protein